MGAAASPLIDAGTMLGAALRLAVLPAFELRILAAHVLGFSRTELMTRDEHGLTAEQAAALDALIRRRIAGEPIAYLVGRREFFGLDLAVGPGVLIPRPETELLVELALENLPRGARVLDLGTGSGVIALALAHTRADVDVTATDASVQALDQARGNAERLAVSVEFVEADWYAGLSAQGFDAIVSNPPYIAAGDTHLAQGDLRFEPAGALTDGADGLSAIRAIVSGARSFLKPAGRLLLEHGYDQADAVRALLASAGFVGVRSWRDLAGIERVSGGVLREA